MASSLRSLLFLAGVTCAAAGACGGNVLVDAPTGGTGASGTGGTGVTTTPGVGGGEPTSTVGAGGVGGTTTTFTTTTFTTTTTTFTTTTSTTSSSTTSSSTTSSSTTTTTATGACTDPQDDQIFITQVVWPVEVQCTMQNLGNVGALKMCLASKLGLTSGCIDCMTADLQCTVQHCLNSCATSPGSQNCTGCRKMSCEASFVACSGQPHDTGFTNCSGVFGNGFSSTPWQRGLDAADFTTQGAAKAYAEYDSCACGTAPCASTCGGSYCMGQVASNQCAVCLKNNCGPQMGDCETN